jgi:hypothetical protein
MARPSQLAKVDETTTPAAPARIGAETSFCRSMDRLIAEHEAEGRSAHCHLLSVIGNDHEIAAIAAAISDEARFYATGPDFGRIMTSLGKDAEVFRATINIPGRRRPLRHLVAISEELSQTRSGGNPSARRTVLSDDDPAFLLYRIGARFGLPTLPKGRRSRSRSLVTQFSIGVN